ncbi:hypothetical protein [Flavobacterium flavigenum]|uniref:hypothetical protein n=1 Tax=Flavobacterium flavigenum TaxID=3003258 RepID=UPI002482EFD5|nr:hypothetical protein [Flavobacterium flavigenum]
MKNILALFLLVSSSSLLAQKIRPLVGVSGYIDTSFDNGGFGDLKLGAEYKIFYYFKPEIEISFMLGALEDVTNRDESGIITSVYSTKISSVNYSFCPKFILGNKDSGDGYIQILPKYTFATIEATENSAIRNPNNLSSPIEKKSKASANEHSLGIGVGYVVDISDDNSQSLAINLYLNNVDLGKALNKLDKDATISTQYVIGFGVNYYFSFKKKTIN